MKEEYRLGYAWRRSEIIIIPAALLGGALIFIVLWDAFETIILPGRVTRKFRFTRLFYRYTWLLWNSMRTIFSSRRQETYMAFYGPLSVILLLSVWAFGIILGFALLLLAPGSPLNAPGGVWISLQISI